MTFVGSHQACTKMSGRLKGMAQEWGMTALPRQNRESSGVLTFCASFKEPGAVVALKICQHAHCFMAFLTNVLAVFSLVEYPSKGIA